jgi:hypothetical protein
MTVALEEIERRPRPLLHLSEEHPVLARERFVDAARTIRRSLREHSVRIPRGHVERRRRPEALGRVVQVRQSATELVRRVCAEPAPGSEDAALDPGEEGARAAVRVDDDLARPSGYRPRDIDPCPLDLLAEKGEELELGADVRDVPIVGPVNPQDETRVARAHLEHCVVEQPDRRQLGVVRQVERGERASCNRLLRFAQARRRLTCTGAVLPRSCWPRR